jgi:hypothetical protein
MRWNKNRARLFFVMVCVSSLDMNCALFPFFSADETVLSESSLPIKVVSGQIPLQERHQQSIPDWIRSKSTRPGELHPRLPKLHKRHQSFLLFFLWFILWHGARS